MSAVEVHHVSKNYPLSHSQWGRLRQVLGSREQGWVNGFQALRDVCFSVGRGEAFGIIGENGSGKSTLLQIVAGILRPSSGSVQVNGRLSALLELGSGFSQEFTGRDNVYLNGSLLGLTRAEIDARFAEIERFAGIGDFIDQPIKTYSTGMVLRLAFAVASHVDPEILIVDEALAVGDIAFRQRCMRKIHDLRARGVTLLFVSHETSDVKALCERCLWLQGGAVQELGETDEVITKYLRATLLRETPNRPDKTHPGPRTALDATPPPGAGFMTAKGGHRYGNGKAAIMSARLIGEGGRAATGAFARERMVLRMGFQTSSGIDSPIAGFLVRNGRGENIFGSNTARENYPLPPMSPGEVNNVDFSWSVPELAPGDYRISLGVADGNLESFQMCDYIEDAVEMRVSNADPGLNGNGPRGYFHLNCASVAIHRNPG